MTKPKIISQKPNWFDTNKYKDKFKLTPLHWYWELMIRKSYLDQIKFKEKRLKSLLQDGGKSTQEFNEIKDQLENYKPMNELRKKTFATLGENPIIPDSQLKSILRKDIWSERNFKSHSARLSTCMDVFKLNIRDDIERECDTSTCHDELGFIYEIPVEDSELMYNTPIDLQHDLGGLEGISEVREAHITIDLAAPNSVLKEDIWKIVGALKKEYGNNSEIIDSKKRNWATSNVLEHIDLHLAEVQQGAEFKPGLRSKWIPPNSDSSNTTKASTREKDEAIKLLDEQVLHQLYIEIYSAENKNDLDRE